MSQNEEYEYQLWGYCIDEIISDLRQVVLEDVRREVDGISDSLKKKVSEEKQPALTSALQLYLHECYEKVSEHTNTAEAYIRDNFNIPPHILLKEDLVQRQQYSDLDKENLEQEIRELSQRINRAHFLEYHLLLELEKKKALQTISEKVKEITLPDVNTLPSNKELHQLMSDCLGLEVEEANCHLKTEDLEEGSEFNQPNYILEVFRKRKDRLPLRNV